MAGTTTTGKWPKLPSGPKNVLVGGKKNIIAENEVKYPYESKNWTGPASVNTPESYRAYRKTSQGAKEFARGTKAVSAPELRKRSTQGLDLEGEYPEETNKRPRKR